LIVVSAADAVKIILACPSVVPASRSSTLVPAPVTNASKEEASSSLFVCTCKVRTAEAVITLSVKIIKLL
tara:strand:- start:508 stop:717 length:210 start_codon:yes stop_codon:yes gene_type:complete